MSSPAAVILFDNEGTLTDSIQAVAGAANAALQVHGFSEVSLEEIVDGMKYETVRRMTRHAVHHIPLWREDKCIEAIFHVNTDDLNIKIKTK